MLEIVLDKLLIFFMHCLFRMLLIVMRMSPVWMVNDERVAWMHEYWWYLWRNPFPQQKMMKVNGG